MVSECVFLADDGRGIVWGIKRDLHDTLIQWDAEWGSDYEVLGPLMDVFEVQSELFTWLGKDGSRITNG